MTRMFKTREITKLLDVLIGKTEAVGETYEDECRLDNLKTLIDVTNWCLDGLQFAMESGYGRAEYSMAEISYTAQCALDEYGRWIADVLGEQMADRKTENYSEKPNNCETCKWGEWYRQGYDITMMDDECGGCCSWNSKWTPKDEPQTLDDIGRQIQDAYDKGLLSDASAVQAWYEAVKAMPQTERMKTHDYCDICNHKGCGNCIANNLDDYCVPSGYEPITKTETQNLNLIIEKADERCKGCNHYKLTCDLFSEICRFEPKDEPQTDGILFKGNLKEGDYKLIKTTNGWVLEGNDIAYCGEPKTERSE